MKKFISFFLIIALSGGSGNFFDADASLPFGLINNSLNIVYSATDIRKTEIFYGDILGLERIEDVKLPGNRTMLRYLVGKTELKFIVGKNDHIKNGDGLFDSRGIRQMTILLPMEKKEVIFKRMKAIGLSAPSLTMEKINTISFSRGLFNDYDGNHIEILFVNNDSLDFVIGKTHIGLGVSDMNAMGEFLDKILGFETVEGYGSLRRYNMGLTQVKFWEVPISKPSITGMPDEILGMSMIQFVISDVIAARDIIASRGGKIHTEPYFVGDLAIIMVVEGPDGILVEFGAAL
tara:strand:+ start:1938 stop:2810 length:873 start_codon:yes stop_codon:yes gene_type:complete